jgi:hypothetical protein
MRVQGVKVADFFDEKKEEKVNQTPTLTKLLQRVIEATAEQINVCKPAIVVDYDKDTQTASVQAVFKNKYRDGSIEDAPIIFSVPVVHPRAGKSFIHLPVKTGDYVLLIFADNSIEKWFSNGQSSFPDDLRKHHISDAFALPCGYPASAPIGIENNDDVILKNQNLEMRIKPNGKVQVLNENYEMLKTIDDFMTRSLAGDHWGAARARNRFRTFVKE